MPKRTLEEKMDHYKKKMDKLKQKQHRKRRRLHHTSSSDQDETIYRSTGDNSEAWSITTRPQPESINLDSVPTTENLYVDTQPVSPPPEAATSDPPLDPEIMAALGETTDQDPTWGPEIHNSLISLWQPLLKKGIDKETRDKLTKTYLIPSNCPLLLAPKLNIEISAAVTEMVRLRDKKVEILQQQLGVGITAVSKAMTQLLTTDNKIEAIKMLSDGCRIFCDLHNMQTQSRIKMISPGLTKNFLNIVQESERDDTLFGTNLGEKIKASKIAEKQGLQIKKGGGQPRSNIVQHNTASRQFQGNWQGPPRYPTNRGTRGGQRRFTTTTRRLTSTSAPAAIQPRVTQGRTRAPTRT